MTVSWLIPVGLTAMELFLLRYLVYGLQREEQKKEPVKRLLLCLFLLLSGLFLRTHRMAAKESGMGSYLNIFSMAAFYYVVLIWGLKINWRLSFYYLVIFDIPADVCDLTIFVVMLRNWGIDVSGNTEAGPALLYLLVSFVLRLAVLAGIRRFLNKDRSRRPDHLQLFLNGAAVLPFLYMRDLGFWLPLGNDEIGYASLLFLALTGGISLILVIGNEKIVNYHIQRSELLIMQHMMRRQHEQYETRKETVNLVNQKYHDMRHQLVAILGMEDVEAIHEYVASLRQEIKPYETFFRTGNQLMDIILSDKAEICRKKGICLIPAVDGQALKMLEAADLCTIFGNALDNAIESCEKEESGSRRILLKAGSVQGFLVIHVENPCKKKLYREEGRLLTTKPDAKNHGYGLQGIRQAVEKYQGAMDTETKNGHFVLTLLLALPEEMPS